MEANNTQAHPVTSRFRRPIEEIIEDLSKPLPARLIKQRKQGGAMLDFIEWHTAVKILDYYAPGWHGEVRSVTVTPDRVVVTYRITIEAAEGQIHREATGNELIDSKGYGDPASNAEAMAFKRAAAKFGLALALYSKE